MNLRTRERPKAEVNLTPLIDVVFLLLIFFMVSTTFDTSSRIKVQLPEAATVHEPNTEMKRITVVVSPNGTLSIEDGYELINSTAQVLKRAMMELSKGDTKVPVIIKADAKAPHQAVMTVMDVASQLGLNSITFAGRKQFEE